MPRAFFQGTDLALRGIEAGSAIPVIALQNDLGSLPGLSEAEACLHAARDAIVAAIDAVAQGVSALQYLPKTCLAYFDRFGRSLRDGEAVEFDVSGKAVQLTPALRLKLLDAANLEDITVETTLRGVVAEMDQEHRRFQLVLAGGRRVVAPLQPQYEETVREAFNGYREKVRTAVRGVMRRDRNGRPQELETVEEVSVLDPLDVAARLDELALLRAGWLDGGGHALSREGLKWFSEAFEAKFPGVLPLPHVYPTEDGGVRAEWSQNGNEASLDVNLEERIAEWHNLNLNTNAEQAEWLHLSGAAGWERLAELVGQLGGEA